MYLVPSAVLGLRYEDSHLDCSFHPSRLQVLHSTPSLVTASSRISAYQMSTRLPCASKHTGLATPHRFGGDVGYTLKALRTPHFPIS